MIDKGVIIGNNCKIYHKGLVNLYGCYIGDNVTIGAFVEIGSGVMVGNNSKIQSHCFIPSGVTIGKNVFIGPNVTFLNDKYPPSKGVHWKKVIIEDDVVIGGGSTILPGVILEKGCIVGAGSVVTKNIKTNKMVIGNPAKEFESKNYVR